VETTCSEFGWKTLLLKINFTKNIKIDNLKDVALTREV
jgi:hypothetical protein